MDSVAAHRAGAMFEAMLLAPVLRPLVAGAGMLGDYELDVFAGAIAQRDRSGFAEAIAERLEAAR